MGRVGVTVGGNRMNKATYARERPIPEVGQDTPGGRRVEGQGERDGVKKTRSCWACRT